jgi:hypothetical protein
VSCFSDRSRYRARNRDAACGSERDRRPERLDKNAMVAKVAMERDEHLEQ